MPSWTFYCWSCGGTSTMIDKVTRADTCPHCGVDMRSCRNCEHWDEDRPDRCCDESFPYAEDVERANFSSRFTPRTSPARRDDDDGAKARLERLFSTSDSSPPR